MLEESMQKIRAAEARAKQDGMDCRIRLQHLLTEAEQQVEVLAEQARETLRQEREDLFKQAEAQAAQAREAILQKTAAECRHLQSQAERNRARAIQVILAGEV